VVDHGGDFPFEIASDHAAIVPNLFSVVSRSKHAVGRLSQSQQDRTDNLASERSRRQVSPMVGVDPFPNLSAEMHAKAALPAPARKRTGVAE
jgi:hypothetical protein